MAALNFPSSPTVGQVYTANGKSWQWDGVSWISYNTLIAAGSNTQIQFNNSGAFGASAGLTWNGTTLTTTGLNNTGNTTLGDAAGDTLTINAGTTTFTQGTANGVLYLNGSKVATSGSGLVFDGNNFVVGNSSISTGRAAIWGDGNGAANVSTNANSQLHIVTTNAAVGANNAARITFNAGNGNGASAKIEALRDGQDTFQIVNVFDGPLVFGTNNTGQARITSKGLLVGYTSDSGLSGTGNAIFSGNVGIGTSSPSRKFEVNGYARFTDGTVQTEIVNGGSVGYIGTNNNYPLAIQTNAVTRATFDTSGNLGLGVTPSAWNALTGLQVKNGAVYGFGGQVGVAGNAYYDGSGWKYISTNAATRYESNAIAGAHTWYTAPSGTAGNPLTFTQAMTLDASGRLLVGATSGTGITNIVLGGKTTASGANAVAISPQSNGTVTVNSQTYTITFNNSCKVFSLDFGNGAGVLCVANYSSSTITILGPSTLVVNSASPGALEFGVSKSANSHSITFTTGSNASSAYGSWALISFTSSLV